MALETEMVYLYPEENSETHKTNFYELVHDEELPVAVLRRGQKFTMAVRFINNEFEENRDEVDVIFNYGPKPNQVKGTKGVVKIQPSVTKIRDSDRPAWFANVLDITEGAVTLEVYAPPSIPVGLWGIQVVSYLKNNRGEKNTFDFSGGFYMICNPWNCHDLVYMPEEKFLDEYVLADVGKIWTGPVGSHRGREWIFGQFDGCVLPAIWLMLENSELEHSRRGDPIRLARTISKMVNSNDEDGGVLEGNWSGHYEDGTAPSAWTGSVAILQEYLETQSTVQYGQCWVFAGVVTTICRALGIPSRVVSNIVSAHDSNATVTIDKYFGDNNEEIYPEETQDSIWNYHVWNDVYMARPDLLPGYGGWQAIDATPQETSDGFMQCGPASLEAIKKGQVGLNYDVAFLVATVNADYIKWKEDATCDLGYSKIYCNKYHIGRYILTKKPFMFDYNGDKDRMDITTLYKPTEGSREERLALMNAVRSSEVAKAIYDLPDPERQDVVFTLEDVDRINIGDDFLISIKISSQCDDVRNVRFTLSVHSVFYNGVKGQRIKKREGELIIGPHTSTVVQLPVTANDYLERLVEYSIMKIYAIATVTETRQTWADEDDFQVIKPTIKITVPDTMALGEVSMLSLRFDNPLKIPLTNCKFNLCGPSVVKNKAIPHPDVGPGQTVYSEIGVSPTSIGEKKLVATFFSKELSDVTGSTKIEVV